MRKTWLIRVLGVFLCLGFLVYVPLHLTAPTLYLAQHHVLPAAIALPQIILVDVLCVAAALWAVARIVFRSWG